jgi:hypothetical protein
MSNKSEKKPLGIPPNYWAKPPARVKPANGFVNKQQKQFYWVLTAFNLAKIAAAAAVALLIIGMI